MKTPTVFISYSHDSDAHKAWVISFAKKLRNAGVDVLIDQWEIFAGDDLPFFMEQALSKSDRVICICTEAYVQKANTGVGGVGYEKMILTAELMKRIDSNKIIPILCQNPQRETPFFLSTKYYLDFSLPEHFDASCEELLRALHRYPVDTKPKLGPNPFIARGSVSATGGLNANEALCRAAANGDIKKIKGLLSRGADLNYHRNFDGATPLQLAIINDNLKAVLLLIRHGASIDEKDNDDVSALDEAVKSTNGLIRLSIGRTFATRAKNIIFGKTQYYDTALCPYCLTPTVKQDSGSDAAGTVWWSCLCTHCKRGHADAH